MDYRSTEGNVKTYITRDAIILSGQSLSAAIDLEQLNIATILFPAAWDAADITFQTSPDGVTYGDLINDSGVEVKRTPTPGKSMGLNIPELSGVRYLKIRSGTSASPVNQAADRTLTLTLTSNAEAPAPSSGGGAVTIADGADVTLGAKADIAVTDATTTNTLMSFVKGLVKILADIWDSTLHLLRVSAVGDYTTITATIANGASLSAEIDLKGHQLAAIFMPGTWTTANLSYQASDQTGGTFQDVYDSAGNELTSIADASRTITDIPELGPIRFLKIRSGTTGTPVNQGGNRTIILLVK